MPSFSTLFIGAVAAFAAFTSAAPTSPAGNNNNNAEDTLVNISNNKVLSSRCNSGCGNVPDILLGVQAQVNVVSDKLNAIVAANVGVAVDINVVASVLVELKTVLVQAVVDVKALVGVSVDVLLKGSVKVYVLLDICHLLVTLLGVICGILSLCVRIVVAVDVKVCLGLVVEIGCLVADLLVALYVILEGLKVILCPLLVSLLPICYGLGLDVLVKAIVIL